MTDTSHAEALGFLAKVGGAVGELLVRELEVRTVGVVATRAAERRYTREEKTTKTGDTRRFAIEPTLLPLLRALHRESGGNGRVLASMPMPNKCELANGLRLYLAVAGVERDELFLNDATRKWITFHDLRATGLTWMAVRGDDALRIKQRAGHSSFSTTEKYIREAEALRDGFGTVFPPLPETVLARPADRGRCVLRPRRSRRPRARRGGKRA